MYTGDGPSRMKPDCTRIWDNTRQDKMTVYLNDFQTLSQAGFKDGQNVLFEMRNHDLSWPEDIAQIHRERLLRKKSAAVAVGSAATQVVSPGLTGLHNLGNTCFFNSAVQCVSHTEPLRMYFEQRYHTVEVNRSNPLGMKGEVAMDFANLVKELWSGYSFSIAPMDFRETICKFSPQFQGHEQHDAQEFLSFLLDGLHEDLNRVTKKPYIELKDSNGRPDAEVAAEEWSAHIQRNNSVIVNLFHGQHRSEIKCSSCNDSSNRFDPFTFLTLSIPLEDRIFVVLFLYRRDGSPREAIAVTIHSDDTYTVIKEKVGEISGISVENLLVAEVYYSLVYRYPTSTDKYKPLQQGGSLYLYEVVHCDPASVRIRRATTLGNDSHQNSGSSTGAFRMAPRKRTFREKLCCITVREIDPAIEERRASRAVMNVKQLPVSTGLVVIHRSLVRDLFALNPFRPVVFGRPIFMTFRDSVTGDGLYGTVWEHVKRFVNSDYDDGDAYPFELKYVNTAGTGCGICSWNSFCLGCEIKPDQKMFRDRNVQIAIDWDPIALHLYYDKNAEVSYKRHPSVDKCKRIEQESISLTECLDMYTREEKMGEDERWKCPTCKVFRPAIKTLQFWRLPPVFVIHLKRFQFVNGKWQKSQKTIDFPISGFRPGKYCSTNNEDVYDLYAVSNHIGYLGSGHYVTNAKVQGKWISFNDSLCKELKEEHVVTPCAYVLFYAKRGTNWQDFMPSAEVPPIPMEMEDGKRSSGGCAIL